jgi:hypothetical protein
MNFSPDSAITISGTGLTTRDRVIMKDGTVLQITVTATHAPAGARSLAVGNSLGAAML